MNEIGIKLADGTFYPILSDTVRSKKIELTTVRDNQETVQIDLFKQNDNLEYIGSLIVENIAQNKAGDTTIELNIEVDSENNLKAEAIDLDGKSKQALKVSLAAIDLSKDLGDLNLASDIKVDDSFKHSSEAVSSLDETKKFPKWLIALLCLLGAICLILSVLLLSKSCTNNNSTSRANTKIKNEVASSQIKTTEKVPKPAANENTNSISSTTGSSSGTSSSSSGSTSGSGLSTTGNTSGTSSSSSGSTSGSGLSTTGNSSVSSTSSSGSTSGSTSSTTGNSSGSSSSNSGSTSGITSSTTGNTSGSSSSTTGNTSGSSSSTSGSTSGSSSSITGSSSGSTSTTTGNTTGTSSSTSGSTSEITSSTTGSSSTSGSTSGITSSTTGSSSVGSSTNSGSTSGRLQSNPDGSVKYRLQWGDTLWDLAETFYKNPWDYVKIVKHNNIQNPNLIIAGTYIDIPTK